MSPLASWILMGALLAAVFIGIYIYLVGSAWLDRAEHVVDDEDI